MTIGKVALTIVGLAVGASIGREGPTVQVGAAIMLAVASFAGIGQARGLVLAGAAAGVAAAFNTPLAGVVFAIEEMAKEFEQRISGPVVGAVVLAGITGLALVGDYRYFGQTSAQLDSAPGLAGRAAVRHRRRAAGRPVQPRRGDRGHRTGTGWWRLLKSRPVWFAAGCGLAVAVLGLLTDGYANGTAYAQARAAAGARHDAAVVAGAAQAAGDAAVLDQRHPGRPVRTVARRSAPGWGRLWPPFCRRSTCGRSACWRWWPISPGVVQAPLTAFVIVLEMSEGSRMVVPLMATALLATGASRLICPHPLYHVLSRRYAVRRE